MENYMDVSLFFVVNGKFLIHSCKKEDGEKYGDFINYPQSHFEIWDKYYVYHDKCIKDLSCIIGTEDSKKIEIREDFHYQCHKCNKNYTI